MLITLSERRLSALIREFFGLVDVTDEELLPQLTKYASKLFVALSTERGLTMQSLGGIGNGIAVYRFDVTTDNRDDLLAGLSLLNPVMLSVERNDLPRLVQNRPILAAMNDCWYEIEPNFQG